MQQTCGLHITLADRQSLREICAVIQDSIRHLCQADHLQQEHHLNAWLAERSVGKLAPLLFNDTAQTFICLDAERIIGVASIENNGVLSLCYVHSRSAGKGVGRMLLNSVENRARELGLSEINLISTATARAFYLAHGYIQYAEPLLYIGMPGYPLRKEL